MCCANFPPYFRGKVAQQMSQRQNTFCFVYRMGVFYGVLTSVWAANTIVVMGFFFVSTHIIRSTITVVSIFWFFFFVSVLWEQNMEKKWACQSMCTWAIKNSCETLGISYSLPEIPLQVKNKILWIFFGEEKFLVGRQAVVSRIQLRLCFVCFCFSNSSRHHLFVYGAL